MSERNQPVLLQGAFLAVLFQAIPWRNPRKDGADHVVVPTPAPPPPAAPLVTSPATAAAGAAGATQGQEQRRGGVADEGIDLRDKETPDAWISRDPDLERLTGNFPFNAETALPALAEGFVTPARKSYVRNHGAVPRLDWKTHRLEVKGLGMPGGRPRSFSMDELVAHFPAREVAVTFSCSGNRRREVNAVKPSVGVPFGAGAVRTGVFKGVALVDLMAHCGFDRNLAHAQCHALREHATDPEGRPRGCFVNFAGPATELAKGEYGTCLLLDHALDPNQDLLLAYEYNGAPILPDHGFPLRLVIPGFIGGRMIKWLSVIEVAPHESASHYYFHDNRLFPATVSLDRATREEWWYRPEYIIGEMNIQSVLTRPAHGEIVLLPRKAEADKERTDPATCTLAGFAYTGGGRRIVIVEISLDEGQTWDPCGFVDHPLDRPNPAGKFWTWRLWQHTVPVARLAAAPSVQVRAWDSSFNTQPNDIAWNVLGMMNNSRYTVAVQPARTREGLPGLLFAHPMPPHEEMAALKSSQGRPPCEVEEQPRPKPQEVPAPTAGKAGHFTRREVERHNKENDTWLVINGRVFDVTTFLNKHPGGPSIIAVSAGRPCEDFDDIHSDYAHKLLKKYYIGELLEDEGPEEEATETETEAEKVGAGAPPQPLPTMAGEAKAGEALGMEPPPPPFLDPRDFKACPLIEKESITHDTRRFRFGLERADQPMGLPLGQHIYVRATVKGDVVMRPYTPTSTQEQRGSFDLVVKVYAAGQDPKHPEGGKLSQHLDRMHLGDTVHVKGPIGRFEWRGRGSVAIGGQPYPHRVTHLGMLAGGTGITPMYQLIQAILRDPDDATRCSLLFANKTPDDILLRPQLDRFAEEAAAAAQAAGEGKEKHDEEPRFRVYYTVDRLPRRDEATTEEAASSSYWPFGLGHVNGEMIQAHLPPPGPGTLVAICGPPPFVHYACRPALERLGYATETIFEF